MSDSYSSDENYQPSEEEPRIKIKSEQVHEKSTFNDNLKAEAAEVAQNRLDAYIKRFEHSLFPHRYNYLSPFQPAAAPPPSAATVKAEVKQNRTRKTKMKAKAKITEFAYLKSKNPPSLMCIFCFQEFQSWRYPRLTN